MVPRASAGELPVGDALLGGWSTPAWPRSTGARRWCSGIGCASRPRRRRPWPAGAFPARWCWASARSTGASRWARGSASAVMAGPGVGKSVLLGMVARHAKADIIVVGLIGERGREVREFVERDLGAQGLTRSVVIVATGDESPLVRVRAGMAATAVAEHYRAPGPARCMLLLDSLSRIAMAQREIGLAAGEPPTSKGYPPSVFATLPRLVERAGNDAGATAASPPSTRCSPRAMISADPVTDAARAALDGHVVLSRKLANAGHFPAVDVLGSVSRCMSDVVTPAHRELASTVARAARGLPRLGRSHRGRRLPEREQPQGRSSAGLYESAQRRTPPGARRAHFARRDPGQGAGGARTPTGPRTPRRRVSRHFSPMGQPSRPGGAMVRPDVSPVTRREEGREGADLLGGPAELPPRPRRCKSKLE